MDGYCFVHDKPKWGYIIANGFEQVGEYVKICYECWEERLPRKVMIEKTELNSFTNMYKLTNELIDFFIKTDIE